MMFPSRHVISRNPRYWCNLSSIIKPSGSHCFKLLFSFLLVKFWVSIIFINLKSFMLPLLYVSYFTCFAHVSIPFGSYIFLKLIHRHFCCIRDTSPLSVLLADFFCFRFIFSIGLSIHGNLHCQASFTLVTTSFIFFSYSARFARFWGFKNYFSAS